MRLLLDTCTFVWLMADAPALSERAIALFESADTELFLSAVSAWEIQVKHGLGKLVLPDPPESYLPDRRARHDIASLPLDEATILHLERLPPIHSDPFDRMLVCSAIQHGLSILTPDAQIRRYPVATVW